MYMRTCHYNFINVGLEIFKKFVIFFVKNFSYYLLQRDALKTKAYVLIAVRFWCSEGADTLIKHCIIFLQLFLCFVFSFLQISFAWIFHVLQLSLINVGYHK